jgi:hypothetical protein
MLMFSLFTATEARTTPQQIAMEVNRLDTLRQKLIQRKQQAIEARSAVIQTLSEDIAAFREINI